MTSSKHGIVIITNDGPAKREFSNRLYEKSGGNVHLVVVQEAPQKPLLKRIMDYVGKVGVFGLPRELWFTALWFLSPKVREAESWLKESTRDEAYVREWVPKTMKVASVNTDEVYEAIAKVSPALIVLWGGAIVKAPILKSAPRVINMHFGWCPYYRGSNANHHAILNRDFEHVGSTIHYAGEAVDAGEILSIIPADPSRPPRQLFKDLNDRSRDEYLAVALRLYNGEDVPLAPQDLSQGKNYRLKEWTYEKRYKLGRMLLEKEQRQ